MNIYFGILFVVSTILRRGQANHCGSLTLVAKSVRVGDTAEFIYTPSDVNALRVWYKLPKDSVPISVYDGEGSSNPKKYIEEKVGNTFKLRIFSVSASDADRYIVSCNASRAHISGAILTVTSSNEKDTNCGTLSIHQNNLKKEGPTIELLFAISPGRDINWQREKNSMFIPINTSTKYEIWNNEDKTSHGLRILQSVYTDSGAYRVKCESVFSNVLQLNIDASQKPVAEFYSYDSQLSVAGPVVGCVFITLVTIIAITVLLVLRKNRHNASLERNGSQQIEVKRRKPIMMPQVDEPVFNNIQGGNVAPDIDLAEYACVIPKADREAATEDQKPTTQNEDQLVYVDLDLERNTDWEAKRPFVTQHEPTEYVSIDFSKTGTVTIHDNCDS